VKVALVIAAAGESARLPGSEPKQFRPLFGLPLVEWTLRKATDIEAVGAVITVVPPGWQKWLESAKIFGLRDAGLACYVVRGGKNRYQSVRIGLEEAVRRGFSAALVHDAARPFASVDLFQRVALQLEAGALAVAPSIAMSDTVRLVQEGGVVSTVPRELLRRVQTPQGLIIPEVLKAFDSVTSLSKSLRSIEPTDDVAMAEAAGLDVHLVEGEALNLKITYEEDWAVAEALVAQGVVPLPSGQAEARLASKQVRSAPVPHRALCGVGFDAHRLESGIPLVLGGARLAYPKGLRGHSDGDVASHAVADALLGAARLGDIGILYPSSDPRNKGRKSTEFLEEICGMLRQQCLEPYFVDVTVIAEEPKIAPHAADIASSLARALSMDISSVSVKATTTDGLGITGRGEGIAALATAVLRPCDAKSFEISEAE